MANEITTGNLVTNGGMVDLILSDLVLEKIYDGTDLSSTMLFIDWHARGGQGMSVTLADAPTALNAEASEPTAEANSAYTTAKFSLTPARYTKAFGITDRTLVDNSVIGMETLATNLAQGVGMTLTDLLCTAIATLSATVGANTAALSVDTVYDAAFKLNEELNFGNYNLVVGASQLNDFRSSLRAESGAIQFVPATADQLAAKGPGYQGRWNGIDIWQCDSTATSGSGKAGGMFSFGAFAYTLADPRVIQQGINAADLVVSNEALIVEKARDAALGVTQLVAQCYPAVALVEDARGVQVLAS